MGKFREEFWNCNRTVDFGFLDSYNTWLMKVKESQQFLFFFFASYAVDIHANEFWPTWSCFYWYQKVQTYLSPLLLEEQTYFQFKCSPVHQRRNQKSWKNSHFVQIHVQFVFFTFSYWVSAMNEHSSWIHISQLSHWNALWPFRTVPLQRPPSALQFVQYQARHQIQFLRVRCHQRFNMKRGSVFRIPHIQGVYLMPYNTFCISHIETWDLGSFQYPQPGW